MVPHLSRGCLGIGAVLGTDPGVQVSKASFKGRLCSCGFFCTRSRKKKAASTPSASGWQLRAQGTFPVPPYSQIVDFESASVGVLSEPSWQSRLESSCSESPMVGHSGVRGVCAEAKGDLDGWECQERTARKCSSNRRGSPVAEHGEG